jgi:hypothetical protein
VAPPWMVNSKPGRTAAVVHSTDTRPRRAALAVPVVEPKRLARDTKLSTVVESMWVPWPSVSRVQLASTTAGLLSCMSLLKNLARDEHVIACNVVHDGVLTGAFPAS